MRMTWATKIFLLANNEARTRRERKGDIQRALNERDNEQAMKLLKASGQEPE
jgi:hypothetical protein